nr:hypothetical protein [Anaerolineae bacterium]
MNSHRILIIDDEPEFADFVRRGLTYERADTVNHIGQVRKMNHYRTMMNLTLDDEPKSAMIFTAAHRYPL